MDQCFTEQGQPASLTGKTALVTGGSSGIGAATVRVLANAGARVAIGYLNGEDRARELCASLPGAGHLVLRVPLDDANAQTRAAEELGTAFGSLNILVHSAGYTRRIPHRDLHTLTPELYNEILTANAGGPYAITRSFLPWLQRADEAVVVAVSSVSAYTGSGSNIAYCAAKAALDTTIRSLARALGPIRFLSVSPAAVDTGFVEGRNRADLEKHAAGTALGRVVSPQDVAQAILAAATLLNTSTGVRIVIDGGHTL
ncbi:3-oxoacyl-[acyl-carrier-protein] reductase FabG [Achromobacter aegrifaciens]|uniref:SDR family NAD(P)-dependent oxidoreductase n=1 Tax=Achromobacter TaxID=222 RepID=UPI0014650116|nr:MULTISPECIES: SDR family oxidoreductase [Achromobacter]MBD9471408.1 SDR family oxidoreductase [Achromobacter sp. ACM01]CAB3819300.1 3-oxoacyl-[acyl-carrier-protein] reductase FabG [Achromobacter aegrifaciens]